MSTGRWNNSIFVSSVIFVMKYNMLKSGPISQLGDCVPLMSKLNEIWGPWEEHIKITIDANYAYFVSKNYCFFIHVDFNFKSVMLHEF